MQKLKSLFILICSTFLLVFLLNCKQITEEVTKIHYITPIWRGSFYSAPANPKMGWAYYNINMRKSFFFDGSSWQIMAQDGISILWKGELASAPANPQKNWAYYNLINGNSYIYTGYSWEYLAKAGRNGSTGILVWLGSLDVEPSNVLKGYAYYNTRTKKSYIYNGSSWDIIAQDGVGIVWKGVFSSAPINPEINWAYYNTTTQSSYIYNGTVWELFAPSGNSTIYISIVWKGELTSPPPNPQIGWSYYNITDGCSYIWDGSVWNIIAKNGANGNNTVNGYLIVWKGALTSAPASPAAGWAYYNSSEKKSYIYDGSSWQILAQDGVSGTTSGSVPQQSSYLYVLLNTPKGNYVQFAQNTMPTVDFGYIGIGSTVKTTTFYISIVGTNSSSLNLTGTPAIQISGGDADQFEVTQPSIKTVASEAYIQDACIAFKPTSIGEKTATITIHNDSPDQPHFTFTIKGTGSYWPKTFDGNEGDGNDAVTKLLTDYNGNIYAIGYGWELINDHSGFDWWIKKFNMTGIQEWEKKLDFYDDYNTYRPKYDNPEYAVLDNFGNLIVASTYNTVKFNASGTELWKLNTGGNLFVDPENNIFIGKSKYSRNGTLLWTNQFITLPIFDSANNIFCTDGTRIRKFTPNGNAVYNSVSVDSTGRYNDNLLDIPSAFEYSVFAGQTYLITWDDRSGTALNTKTGSCKVSAKYGNTDSYVFKDQYGGYGNCAKKIKAKQDGNLIVIMDINYPLSMYEGSYALAMYKSYEKGTDFLFSDWQSAEIPTNGTQTYTLNVKKGMPYIICVNESGSNGDGTKTADVTISAAYSSGETVFSNEDNTFLRPQLFFASKDDTVTVTVKTDGSSPSYAGTYGIAMKELEYLQPRMMGFETGIENITSICLDSGNNIYAAGYNENKAGTYSKKDIVIKKFSPQGLEIQEGWNKTIDYGHCDDEVPNKILFDGTNIILSGTGYDSISGASGYDGLLYKYSSTGNTLTSFKIPYWSTDCYYIGKDTGENFYFIGYESGNCLLQYTSNGVLLRKIKIDINNFSVTGPDVLNNIYIGGYGVNLINQNSNHDWYIQKY